MNRVVIFALLMIVVVGSGTFLATRNITPPSHKVEKVLPNGTFLK